MRGADPERLGELALGARPVLVHEPHGTDAGLGRPTFVETARHVVVEDGGEQQDPVEGLDAAGRRASGALLFVNVLHNEAATRSRRGDRVLAPVESWRDKMAPVTAQTLDGEATLRGSRPSSPTGSPCCKERGVVPGLGTVLVGDDPGSHWYVGAKHQDCADDRHRLDPPRPARDRHAGRGRGGHRRAQRRPGLHRLPRAAAAPASTSSRCSSRVDPDKDVDGLHPVNLGKLVLGERGAAARARPSASSSCCAATASRSTAPRSSWSAAASPSAARSACCSPGAGERHRHAVPHRHPRPRRARPQGRHRRRGGRRARHHHRGHGQARRRGARRRRLAASTARSPATSTPTCGRSPAGSRPNPKGVGPMTRAMLLSNIVRIAEKAASLTFDPLDDPARADRTTSPPSPRSASSTADCPRRTEPVRTTNRGATPPRSAARSTW